MILRELYLNSFGKFQNKIIQLEEGLNVLYGENESGKTTIHNFIDGMFYGFLKPYARRRNYLEGLKKYRPWNGQGYSGILKLSQNGNIYRIERDFEKGEVKVYDDLIGTDITHKIDSGEKLKDHLPGIYFFDFNNMVYNNTISIKQLDNKIDSDLSKEVKDRLANISTSLDDDISVKNAINDLDKELDRIGTERAYTKPYGRAIRDLEDLVEERKYLLEKKEEYDKHILESFILKEKIEKEEENLEHLNTQLKQMEILDKKKTYLEVLNINSQIKQIDKQIIELKEYANLSFEDYALAVKLERDIEYISKEIQGLKHSINSIEEKLKKTSIEIDENIIEGIKVDELYEEMDTLEEMEDEKNNIILNSQRNRLDILNSELKDKESKIGQYKISIITLILLVIASFGLIFVNKFFSILAVAFTIFVFNRRNSYKKLQFEIKSLNAKIEDIEDDEDKNNKRLLYIENFQKEILLKYNCSSKTELRRLKDNIYFKHSNRTIKIKEIEKLKGEREENLLVLENKNHRINELTKELETIRANNNSDNLEEFKSGLDKRKRYEGLIKDKESKVQVLEKILGDKTLEELEKEIKSYGDNYLDTINNIDKDILLQDVENKKESLQMNMEINARLEERIDNLNKDVKRIIIIEEEIGRIEALMNDYQNRIKSINIAKETIENISKEIHHQFAPTINRNVSKMIDIISNGKYREVKIDESLNISIENPSTKEIIPIDYLSGGTIDQLYFALRFSIISSMKGEYLPLILDDCFIQYDDERLKNILEYLNRMSDEKQILLFTCHNREKQILDDLRLKYNLINLN